MLRVVSTVYFLLQKKNTQQNVKMISFKMSDQLSHLKNPKKEKKKKRKKNLKTSGMYRPTVRYKSSRVRNFN